MNKEHLILYSESDRQWCQQQNVRITYPGQPDYPFAFHDLPVRPAILFYMGEPVWLTHKLISVVGSRSPQQQSLKWMDDHLGKLLETRKVGVVSGGARGVDQKAHQLALRAERPTIAFVPSGLRYVYPENFQEWVAPILNGGGCVVSTLLPSATMRKYYFRERNRWIAALSPFTLVIECARRSGTLLTANFARDYHRDIGVMPTFPGEAGMGGLDLLCDCGATPVRDYVDLQSVVDRFSELVDPKD